MAAENGFLQCPAILLLRFLLYYVHGYNRIDSMKRFALVIAAILGIALLFGTEARGALHRQIPLNIALKKAYQLWGVKPCGANPHVVYVALPNGISGEAVFQTPHGEGEYLDPPSIWTGCTIRLSTIWTAERIESEWSIFCTTIMHEWGHLTGHVHSDEPEFNNAPGVPSETPEQTAVMHSGTSKSSYPDDTRRCGIEL